MNHYRLIASQVGKEGPVSYAIQRKTLWFFWRTTHEFVLGTPLDQAAAHCKELNKKNPSKATKTVVYTP